MRHRALSTAIGAAILTSGSASPAQSLLSGIYVLDREHSDNVSKAITSGIDEVPIATRALAGTRLRKSNTPSDGFRVYSSPDRFTIKDDDKPTVAVSTSGEPIRWKLLDGQVFDVSAKANGGTVSLTFRAAKSEPTTVWANSERTTVYRSVGQELVAETTIIGPELSKPIRYKLVYNRVR